MKKFRFVHCADLHLDSPFKGIGDNYPEISDKLANATYEAFHNVIELCLRKEVNFLLVSGDTFEDSNPTLKAQLAFLNGCKRLAEASIQTYIVYGNHDPMDSWSPYLEWPAEVHKFPADRVRDFTIRSGDIALARVFGISHKKAGVSDNLAKLFNRDLESKLFQIGVLHCNLGDTSHFNYAPCTINDLKAAGMDYWALGHIHKTSIESRENPVVIYAGNTQGRKFSEKDARGCYLVNVDSNGVAHYEFTPVDVVRFDETEIDVSGLKNFNDILNAVSKACDEMKKSADGRDVIARCLLKGRTHLFKELHKNNLEDIRNQVNQVNLDESPFVILTNIEGDLKPEVDFDKIIKSKTFVADFLKTVAELRQEKRQPEIEDILGELYLEPAFKNILEKPDKKEIEKLLDHVNALGIEFLYTDE